MIYDVADKENPRLSGSCGDTTNLYRINSLSLYNHNLSVSSLCWELVFDVSDRSNPFRANLKAKYSSCYSDVSYDYFHFIEGCYRYSLTNLCEARYAPWGCNGSFNIFRIVSPACSTDQSVSLRESDDRAPACFIGQQPHNARRGDFVVYDKLGRYLGTWNGNKSASGRIVGNGVFLVGRIPILWPLFVND